MEKPKENMSPPERNMSRWERVYCVLVVMDKDPR
jgi:hypothetical protein